MRIAIVADTAEEARVIARVMQLEDDALAVGAGGGLRLRVVRFDLVFDMRTLATRDPARNAWFRSTILERHFN
jgi:hypothetical protein